MVTLCGVWFGPEYEREIREGRVIVVIADMHMHTLCSDGDFEVEEVISRAVETGVELISITDHDTIAGVARAREYSRGKIGFIEGTEITCREESRGRGIPPYSFHLLGYGFDENNESLKSTLAEKEKKFYAVLRETIKGLEQYGMKLAYEEIPIGCGNMMEGRDIVEAVRARFPDSPELQAAIRHVAGMEKRLDEINFPVEKTLRLLHGAGGKVVWGHPFHVYSRGQKQKAGADCVSRIMDSLAEEGIDGVEAYYLDFTEEERAFLAREAERRGLFTTSGSDFHGFPGRDRMVSQPFDISGPQEINREGESRE